jgi:hypothetical protein
MVRWPNSRLPIIYGLFTMYVFFEQASFLNYDKTQVISAIDYEYRAFQIALDKSNLVNRDIDCNSAESVAILPL